MKKVYLSPSSQIHNAYTGMDTTECIQCNRIAEAAEAALKRCGVEVKRAPFDQDMNVTIRESNAYGPDLHIPIHTNAGGGQGPLVMVYDDKPVSMAAAQPIYDAVHAVTSGGGGYGIRVRKDLAELSGTKATAVYIECEFHDRPDLAQWIVDNVVPLGEAIAQGVKGRIDLGAVNLRLIYDLTQLTSPPGMRVSRAFRSSSAVGWSAGRGFVSASISERSASLSTPLS